MAWMKIAFDDGCHVAWSVRTSAGQRFLHAIGDGPEGNRITEDMAKMRFEKSRFRTPWLPILFPKRALIEGRRSINCVTAATGAFCRGWFWLP
jgi:hypothetical protein